MTTPNKMARRTDHGFIQVHQADLQPLLTSVKGGQNSQSPVPCVS